MIIVYFDGGCEPKNPGGVSTWGFAVHRDGEKIHEAWGLATKPFTPDATSNMGEYTAALRAVEYLVEKGLAGEKIEVRGDSQLIVNQVSGNWKVKAANLRPLHGAIRKLLPKFTSIRFTWIPREENAEADELAGRAYLDYKAGRPVR
jgi:ribonuclease HI